jgi:hypothetical protein
LFGAMNMFQQFDSNRELAVTRSYLFASQTVMLLLEHPYRIPVSRPPFSRDRQIFS